MQPILILITVAFLMYQARPALLLETNFSVSNNLDSLDDSLVQRETLDISDNFAIGLNQSLSNDTSGGVENGGKTPKVDTLGMVMEPIFFTTGVVGNSLTIRVLLGKDFRALPVSLTLVCLAISDMTITILHPFNRSFFRKLVGVDIRSINGDIGCKLFFWGWRSAKMTSSWFVVFVCIERFLVVWFPLKVKQISTRRNTLCGLLGIYITICSITGAWTFASGLKNGACVPDMKAKGFEEMTRVFLITGTMVYSGLPSALMITFTALIITKLFVSRRQRKKLSTTVSNADTATLKITAMLIGITIAYILLVNPHAILHNIAFATGKDFFESTSPMIKTGREIAQVLEQINYSINFFMYILCSAQFRRRVTEVLGLTKCIKEQERKESHTRRTDMSESEDSKQRSVSVKHQVEA
ncbi:cysteinyl leukotriene receptor 2-like [Liolophura sinensis]|uniref:cysteinyl leukotriene receptor 2-like n=1 Tax=Liolophura sinensis TaxID=3198878 RepID=UPI0031594D97